MYLVSIADIDNLIYILVFIFMALMMSLSSYGFHFLIIIHCNLDRCCLDNRVLGMSRKDSRKLEWRNIRPLPHIVTTGKLMLSYQRLFLIGSEVFSTGKHPLNHVFRRIQSIRTRLEESSSAHAETYSGNDVYANKDLQEELPSQPLRSNEVLMPLISLTW